MHFECACLLKCNFTEVGFSCFCLQKTFHPDPHAAVFRSMRRRDLSFSFAAHDDFLLEFQNLDFRFYGKRFLNLISTPNVPFWSRSATTDIDRVTIYST